MITLHHSDNIGADLRLTQCERCGRPHDPRTSAWGLCLACLEDALAEMPTEELRDVPGAVLELVGLKEEYFNG